MIEPFQESNVRLISKEYEGLMTTRKVISYGLSSYGYDLRVAGEFKIFTNLHTGIIDPKNFNQLQFHEVTIEEYNPENWIIIPPNAFALARSVEYFRIPRNVIGIVLGKSTLARCGLIANITALEPSWEGHLTIELSNTAPLPMKVYAYEGIAQAIFFEADEVCEMSYADKKGKYQGQVGIQLPIV
jgi:dCTP deaminase